MVSELGLYILNSDNSVTPFPSKEEQITLYDFSFEAQRMGAAPEIQASIPAGGVLESTLTTKVFCEYNGERYYLKNPPSSSKDNADPRYNFELTFVSERTILDTVYMIDAVQGDSSIDRPQSNSTNVVFMATIQEYVGRLNAALAYAGLDYSVVLDEGATSESVLVSFQDKFFTEALQEGVKLYHIPYYYVGKVIHFGVAQHILPRLKYGDGLLRVTKTLRTDSIVTRATATGSSENIPYYYPNPTPKGFIEISNPQELDITFESALKLSNIPDGHFLGYREVRDKVKLLCQYSTPYVNNYDTNVKKGVFESDGVIGFDGLLLVSGLHVSSYEPTLNLELSCSVVIEGNIVVTQDQIYNSLIWVEREGQWGMTMDKTIEVKKSLTSSEDEAGNLVWRISVNVPSCPTNEDILVVIALNNRRKYKNEYPVRFSFLNTQIGQEAGWYIMDATGAISSGPVNIRDYGLIVSTPPREGDKVSYNVTKKIPYASKLMPPIYRDSDGVERFYNAINGQYGNLVFENEYHEQNRKEAITSFENIKPTIVGITNSAGDRIDMFVDFAYDLTDNDETVTTEESSEYLHPYFYAKLCKFDGAHGFNLFAQAIESGEMTIEMTSGVCGACKFVIAVDENTQRNLVLVDEEGNLVYDDVTGKVKMASDARGLVQQNDTQYNEVWVALKKDFNTYGQIMPNVAYNHKPSTTDTFVITNILLPEKYIRDAEKRLEDEIIAFLFKNNAFKFDYDIDFSRIFLKTHKDVTDILSENTIIPIEYNGNFSSFYVTSFTYQKRKQEVLPEISVSLTEDFETEPSSFQSTISAVEENIVKNIVASGVGTNVVPDGRYLRKDIDDSVKSRVTFEKGITVDNDISSPDFQQGDISGAGFAIYTDNKGNKVLEIDRAIIRKDTKFNEVVINQTTFQLGATVFSGGGCNITDIQEIDNVYRCFYDNKSGTRFSGLVAGDQVRCQRYDASHASMVKYYWRVVANVGDDYVDLYISGVDANGVSLVDGTDIPEIGDDIVHFGNRTDTTRQSAIIINPLNGGSVEVYAGINSFSLEDKNYVGMGVNPNTQEAYLYGYGDIYIGDRDINADGATFVTYQKKEGDNKRKVFISADISLGSGSTGLSNLSEFQQVKQDAESAKETANNAFAEAKDYTDQVVKDLQDQLDGKVESFFYDYDPTLGNLPASEWTTDELKAEHLNDTFTNTTSGRSWRWLEKDGSYQWVEIADTQSAEALAKAQEALGVANGKVTVFVEKPMSPYKVKDLWLQGSDGRIKRCVKTRTTTGTYYAADWVNADDSHEYTDKQLASYRAEVNATVEALDNAIATAEANANKYTDEGKAALQARITALNNAKANIEDVYDKTQVDGKVTTAEQNALTEAKKLADAAQAAAKATAEAYADGKVTAEEKARLEQAQQILAKAQEAMAKATEAMEEAEAANSQITAVSEDLKKQIDGKVESYFEVDEDTRFDISGAWTEEEKASHEGDTFTDIKNGFSWKWKKVDGEYQWVAIENTATEQALANAAKAQDTADGKRTIYYQEAQPTPSYQKGDLWSKGDGGQLMVCTATRAKGEKVEEGDWVVADDSHRYTDTEVQKAIEEATEAINNFITGDYAEQVNAIQAQLDKRAETWYEVDDPSTKWDDAEKTQHTGDLWYKDGKSYTWSGTSWVESDVPQEVYDKIDGKAEIFTSKPTSYRKNDMWVLEKDYSLYMTGFKQGVVVFATKTSDAFSWRDWSLKVSYTDDTTANAALAEADAVQKALAPLLDDGIITESEKASFIAEYRKTTSDDAELRKNIERYGIENDYSSTIAVYKAQFDLYWYELKNISDSIAGGNFEIDADSFRLYQRDYYSARTTVLDLISAASKGLIDAKTESHSDDYDGGKDVLAEEWAESGTEAEHEGDIFTNTETGATWHWLNVWDGDKYSYQWVATADVKAQASIARLADDGIISEVEKPALRIELEQIKKDLNNLFTKWELNGYPEDWGFDPPYYGKYETYRTSLQSILDAEGDVEIDAEAFKTQQTEYYTAYTNTLNKSEQTFFKKSVIDIHYLKSAFPKGKVLDVNGVTLSTFIGVKDTVGTTANVAAGLYGGGSPILNDNGWYDPDKEYDTGTEKGHGTLMIWAGADNAQDPTTATTRIYEDGTIYTTKLIATNADISGKIVAESGQIGNYRIEADSITARNSNNEDGGALFKDFIIFVAEKTGGEDETYTATAALGLRTFGQGVATSCLLRLENNRKEVGISQAIGAYIDINATGSFRIDNYAIYTKRGDIMMEQGCFKGFRPDIKIENSDYSLKHADSVLICNNTSATATFTLPESPYHGQTYTILHTYTNKLTIKGSATHPIWRISASNYGTASSHDSGSRECIVLWYDSKATATFESTTRVGIWFMTYINA